MARIYFCRSKGIGGALIRFFTFSEWNHVAIEIDGYVYEALASTGVTKTPVRRYGKWDKLEVVDLSLPDSKAAVKFLDKQVGKPYDWTALAALPFRESWQKNSKWFCSELFAAMLTNAGLPAVADIIPSHRVTPKDARMIAKLLQLTQSN